MVRVQVHFRCAEAALSRAGVFDTLAAAGIEAFDGEGSTESRSPCLVFLQAVERAEIESVKALSRDGVERLVALPLEDQASRAPHAWRLLDAGACDVVTWDGQASTVQCLAERLERWHAVDRLLGSPAVQNNLVGIGRTWVTLLRQVVEVARFSEAPLLIQGESGTGKELLARLVHTLDPRSEKRELIVLDCSTVVPELSGSEFFGHERGAYTGATGLREGAFALADGGTLFLDEVGELPGVIQPQLLRAVQERSYKRVGSNVWQRSDFRLVCATNRELEADVGGGRFRADLYHRLAGWVCRVPPLRERREDIPRLIQHYLATFRPGTELLLCDAVREQLLTREYPGNVRELRHLVLRICQRHVGSGPITVGDLPASERPVEAEPSDWRTGPFADAVRQAVARGVGLREIGRSAEELAVDIAVGDELGNLQRAASRLGVTDRALQMRRANRRG